MIFMASPGMARIACETERIARQLNALKTHLLPRYKYTKVLGNRKHRIRGRWCRCEKVQTRIAIEGGAGHAPNTRDRQNQPEGASQKSSKLISWLFHAKYFAINF